MQILGIYITATLTWCNIYKVKFYYACNRTVLPANYFLGKFIKSNRLYQFQINTRCQCYLIMALGFITVALVFIFIFKLIVCKASIVSIHIFIRFTSSCMEINIRSQCSKLIHHIIDTKVVAMSCRTLCFLIERHLSYTVNGVVGIVDNVRHTVACTMQ